MGSGINLDVARLRPRSQPLRQRWIRRLQDGKWFVCGIMICATFLQRFGVPFGAYQMIPIAGPVGLMLAAFGLRNGTIAFDRRRLVIFMVFLFLVALGGLHDSVVTPPLNAQISIPSYVQFLGITAFTTFVFAEPMDEAAFFEIVSFFMLLIAFCGIIQFFIQFAGIQIFTFAGFLPSTIIAETGWNLQISFGIGELLKSNGFFLLEPSITSQYMAIAIIIEILYFRRVLYLSALGLCFVLAFSGTGGIVLIGFVISVVLRLGLKGIVLALLLLLFGAVIAGGVMLLSPEIADMAQGRLDEFQTMGTSGHDRFVTPFWVLSDVLNASPMTGLFGLGGGSSEKLTITYEHTVNTPIKIALEYGFPALFVYFSLFLTSYRTPRQSVLVLPAIILLMLTGAYQQFASIVFLMTMLICTASLKPPNISIKVHKQDATA